MRWRIPVKKGDYILVALGKALRTRRILNIEAKRLSGKLQHYSEMVSGKFNRCLIIHMGNPDGEDEEEIVIGRETLICMVWWLINIRVMKRDDGARLPHPDGVLVHTALVLHMDAAGGATKDQQKGWEVVNLTAGEWARGSWSDYIIDNTVHHGRRWGHQLSFLEGFTDTLAVPLWTKEIQQAGEASLMIDNLGFVYANEAAAAMNIYGLSANVWLH